MNAEIGKFIEIFVTIILPIGILLLLIGNRFEGLDKEIEELKKRIEELNEEIKVIENKEN